MGQEATQFIQLIREKFRNNSPKVILEIGSRDLDQSIQFIQEFPDARVIAFEPNPEMLPLCREKLKFYPKIELYEFAISDEEGVVDFYVTDRRFNAGASSLLEPIDQRMQLSYGPHPEITWRKITGITVRRLDNFLIEKGITSVDVMWLDVQGVELKALKSMGRFFDDVKLIHTEAAAKPYYKGHGLKNELEEFLTDNNFEFTFNPALGHRYDEGDLVCIRKGL